MLPLDSARDAVLAEAIRLIDGLGATPSDGRPERRTGRAEGILVVDKPIGPTSHDVVAIVRRLSGVRRVGHGGALDPFAAGVLPVFLGRATRMVEYHLGDEKAYRAVMVFGARSTTDDLDGELTPVDGSPPSRDAVEAALGALVGVIEQTPRSTPRCASEAGTRTTWLVMARSRR